MHEYQITTIDTLIRKTDALLALGESQETQEDG